VSATATSPFEVDLDALKQLPAEEQREQIARVAFLKDAVKKNPLWGYMPHEGELGYKIEKGLQLTGREYRGQLQYHEATRDGIGEAAFVAGNRGGKTYCGLADDVIQLLPPTFLPPWLLPYKRWGLNGEEVHVRVIGVDLANWLEKAVIPRLRRMIPAAALYKGDFDRAYSERKRMLMFADGSWMDFLTHDMDIDSFASADLHRAHFDEEPPGERGARQHEETLIRLADYDGDLRWTLTPLLGLNFVYYELTDGEGEPRNDDECVVIVGDIDHNPHLSERGRRKALRKIGKDPLRLAARKSGRWVHFAGLIYDEFDENVHVVPERDLPRDESGRPTVDVYEAIDSGINEDHKAAFIAAFLEKIRFDEIDPELVEQILEQEPELERQGYVDRLEIFHAWKEADLTVKDVAAHILDIRAVFGYRPRLLPAIDPSARNRNPQNGQSVQDEFRKHLVHTRPGNNSREAGFNAIKERLRRRPVGCVVQAQNEEFLVERREYRWRSPRGVGEDAPKPEPIKRKDDLMDTWRYLVMGLPPLGRAPRDEDEDLDDKQRLVRDHLKSIVGRGRRRRIGGHVPA
jgi:hypothetical protein